VKYTDIRVSVTDGPDYASAQWNEAGDFAEIQVSNGGQIKLSPKCLELLHDALHEIFGKGTT
jgi:hypothetical protein